MKATNLVRVGNCLTAKALTTKALATKALAAVAALALAGCNAGPLLTTGSLSAQPVAAPKPVTSIERALHVAATSTRAEKCGFYFDAAAVRSNFLAAEAARGTPPDELVKVTTSYDFTQKSVAEKIPTPDTYCTSQRAATIKPALQAVLGGNFEPPVERKEEAIPTDIFGNVIDNDPRKDEFNKEEIYDPIMNDPGKSSRPH